MIKSINLSRLLNSSYSVIYKLPLGNATQTWTTDDFTQFVRKYAMLTMSNITIIDIVIKYEGLKNGRK